MRADGRVEGGLVPGGRRVPEQPGPRVVVPRNRRQSAASGSTGGQYASPAVTSPGRSTPRRARCRASIAPAESPPTSSGSPAAASRA
ncbi:MAG: hypothetical protein WA890_26775, partial [Micromonospora sp.]